MEVPPEEEEVKERGENEEDGENGEGEQKDQEDEEEEEEDEAFIRRNRYVFERSSFSHTFVRWETKGFALLVRCREISTLARFNPRGDLIYVGTNRGNINIWDVQTKEVSPLSPLSVHSGRASTEN